MSKEIDERVVEMRFDNKQFEENVRTSMSTLDKLKQKLNLSGASKGLEDVESAAKKVDVSGLGKGIETVQMKFSALQVMGVTALANITNSAVNAGERHILWVGMRSTGMECPSIRGRMIRSLRRKQRVRKLIRNSGMQNCIPLTLTDTNESVHIVLVLKIIKKSVGSKTSANS